MLLLVKSGMQCLIYTRRRIFPLFPHPKSGGGNVSQNQIPKDCMNPVVQGLNVQMALSNLSRLDITNYLVFLRSRKKLGARIQVVNK